MPAEGTISYLLIQSGHAKILGYFSAILMRLRLPLVYRRISGVT